MKVIDTSGTDIRIRRTVGKSEWFYSTDGINYTKATFKKCLEVVSNARTTTKIIRDEEGEVLEIRNFTSRHAEFLKQLAK